MTNPAPAVTVRGLHKHYGDKHAVDGLDLTVATGEIFAILGPNGAGKSTTVEILEGHRKRDAGTVEVLGVDPQHADAHWRARVGIVLQDGGDLGESTVGELVHHYARYYPHGRDADEIIDAVGLREKVGARAHALSGGQRRRLDVALGIVGDPELLFLDEPTTGFDPQARRDFWDLIRALRDHGTTILLTTHYLDEAEQLADRVAVVKDGRIVALDTPADLGGRTARDAIVRWTVDGEHREVRTATPTAVVAELAASQVPAGGEIPGLAVVRPTLEDIYLDLIGERSLATTTPGGAR